MTCSDCSNSIFKPLPLADFDTFRFCDCLKFIHAFLVLSSSFGSAGSRLSALIPFISLTMGGLMGECAVIIPRFVLCSKANSSPVKPDPAQLSCCERCSLVNATWPPDAAAFSLWGAAVPSLCDPIAPLEPGARALPPLPTTVRSLPLSRLEPANPLATALNVSSSDASSFPSISEFVGPASISLAMRSASSRFSRGIVWGSSLVVYRSSSKVVWTPNIDSLASN
mmetsp:Transcript_66943/g.131943  ORF Transcript_66943/g.131943 Transcript_66943/m.131943 type:complete len:225 (+) Transcript_66943:1305-1979(+)